MRIRLLALVFLLACSCGERVELLGVFGESRTADVLGQDGVTPIPFDANTTLWTFGDTIIEAGKRGVSVEATFRERVADAHMLSNSLAFTAPLTEDTVRNPDFVFYKEHGRIVQFIRYAPGEDPARIRLWALDGVRVGNRVYVYYVKIRIDDPEKLFAFTPLAVGLARWNAPAGWRRGDPVRFQRLPDLFPGTHPAFGACVLERDGAVYVIGQRADGLRSSAWIARVRREEIEHAGAYRFLAPDGSWTGDIGAAAALFGDVMGECSLSHHPGRGGYRIVYCRMFSNTIMMATFEDFASIGSMRTRAIVTLAAPEGSSGRPGWYYSGKEIFAAGDRLYVVCMHPFEYQPHLIRARR